MERERETRVCVSPGGAEEVGSLFQRNKRKLVFPPLRESHCSVLMQTRHRSIMYLSLSLYICLYRYILATYIAIYLATAVIYCSSFDVCGCGVKCPCYYYYARTSVFEGGEVGFDSWRWKEEEHAPTHSHRT